MPGFYFNFAEEIKRVKYNKMFTMKTIPEFLERLGNWRNRNRERCIFYGINQFACINQRLRQTIINAMGGAYGKSD